MLMQELDSVLGRPNMVLPVPDWSSAAETVYNRFGKDLVELSYFLSHARHALNLTEIAVHSRAAAFGLLLPFLPGKLLYRPSSPDHASLMVETLLTCSRGTTKHLKAIS
jgi:hypothetical protein